MVLAEHIKDVMAFMKIVVNPVDEIAWIRALTLFPGIGPGYAGRIYELFRKSGRDVMAFIRSQDISKTVPYKAQKGYERFQAIMKAITHPKVNQVPGEIIETILDAGYETHILANFENAKDRIDDIHELINFSHEYKAISSFLSDITLRENFRGETVTDGGEDDEQLVLSTIHQAKGLEWDTVMIIGLCEGQFPHPKAMKEEAEMEEERRLFYVATTRAKKSLYMMHPLTRYDYQMGTVVARRSRFLEELAKDDYEVWEVEGAENHEFDADTVIELD
ncbi:3'-5' exonuclease [Candidatus Omnitrophota bacterium]